MIHWFSSSWTTIKQYQNQLIFNYSTTINHYHQLFITSATMISPWLSTTISIYQPWFTSIAWLILTHSPLLIMNRPENPPLRCNQPPADRQGTILLETVAHTLALAQLAPGTTMDGAAAMDTTVVQEPWYPSSYMVPNHQPWLLNHESWFIVSTVDG